jgi:hypothetical protein
MCTTEQPATSLERALTESDNSDTGVVDNNAVNTLSKLEGPHTCRLPIMNASPLFWGLQNTKIADCGSRSER